MDDVLTDEQLQDLFSDMKKETQNKREKEMQKMKFDKGEELDELGGLEDEFEGAMRGLESDEDTGRGGIEEMDDPQPVAEPKYFNDKIKQQLKAYRE